MPSSAIWHLRLAFPNGSKVMMKTRTCWNHNCCFIASDPLRIVFVKVRGLSRFWTSFKFNPCFRCCRRVSYAYPFVYIPRCSLFFLYCFLNLNTRFLYLLDSFWCSVSESQNDLGFLSTTRRFSNTHHDCDGPIGWSHSRPRPFTGVRYPYAYC